ncbi:MAG: helix-turn-helix transcriptional regulator [Actinomycetes bacterium]
MATHLSFPQIAQRLYVSPHTVKSQAKSVYRKLGVSSRGQAVDLMAEMGVPH